MPQFRVIAGPWDGDVWDMDDVDDNDYFYISRTPKDSVEHIYRLQFGNMTAIYLGARRFERKEVED